MMERLIAGCRISVFTAEKQVNPTFEYEKLAYCPCRLEVANGTQPWRRSCTKRTCHGSHLIARPSGKSRSFIPAFTCAMGISFDNLQRSTLQLILHYMLLSQMLLLKQQHPAWPEDVQQRIPIVHAASISMESLRVFLNAADGIHFKTMTIGRDNLDVEVPILIEASD